MDGDQVIRYALVLDFSPHLLRDLMAAAIGQPDSNPVDTLFANIITLTTNIILRDPKLLQDTLTIACGIPDVTKQLLKRIGQLRKWGPTGYTAILRIIHALQSKEDILLVFIDNGIYNRLISGYWKLERMSESSHGMGSPELGAFLSYAVATMGE